jgi:hypothetical protein
MRKLAVRAVVLIALAAATACKREPTFDERYASAQKAVADKARDLDHDMATRAADAEEMDEGRAAAQHPIPKPQLEAPNAKSEDKRASDR